MMRTIYKVTVEQTMIRDGERTDASFTEYHTTMKGASYVVNRFSDGDEPSYREIHEIRIKAITLQGYFPGEEIC